MSGSSDSCECPNCGATAQEYTDWKPFNYTTITCYECGLTISPVISYMDLETLNEERESNELDPISKLPNQEQDLW